jgi:hypothetical protein
MSSEVRKSLHSNALNHCYAHQDQSGICPFLPIRVTQRVTQIFRLRGGVYFSTGRAAHFAFQRNRITISVRKRAMNTPTSEPQPLYITLRVLLRRESDREQEQWVAQCLEYDIAAQGRSLSEVKSRFERTVMGNVVLSLRHDEFPFANLLPAPEQYHRLWETATALQDTLPMSLPSNRVPANAREFPSRVPRGQALLRVA